MPIYAYKCSVCSSIMEIMAKMNDPAPIRCENCGVENQLQKLISRTAFKLKGDGWYNSGYEGKSNRSASDASATVDSASSTASSTASSAASSTTSNNN